MKEIVIKNRPFGKTWNMINDLVQNPKKVCVCSLARKKQLQKQFPELKDKFKTWKEVTKKVEISMPKFTN